MEAIAIITALAPLFEKFGVPFVQQLFNMFGKTAGPTPEDWAALIAATAVTARQKMLEVLAAQGIDPNSDQGKALLALVP